MREYNSCAPCRVGDEWKSPTGPTIRVCREHEAKLHLGHSGWINLDTPAMKAERIRIARLEMLARIALRLPSTVEVVA